MDLEGVAALAAAGVAAIGIPAALLVGRWQLRGALATAEETRRAGVQAAEEAARAGIAQAEANYRAALDAVRASAAETHAQWLRDVRRQTYSAFLLACHEMLTASLALSESSASHEPSDRYDPDQYEPLHNEAQKALIEALRAELVVRLEGPDPVAQLATRLIACLKRIFSADNYMALLAKARHDLEKLAIAERHRGIYAEFLEAVRSYELLVSADPSRGAYEFEEDVPIEFIDAWKEVQQTRFSLRVEHFNPARLLTEASRNSMFRVRTDRADAAREWDELQRDYVQAVRELLDTPTE